MTLRAWRIVKAKHAASAFSGLGAKEYGGRWNSPGVAVVYTAETASLALLELLVHLNAPQLLERYVLMEASFDSGLVSAVDAGGLPRSWRGSPPSEATQRIGDRWTADGKSAVLRVPSAVLPHESIYLLNPAHPDFERIRIGAKTPVRLDPRLK